VTVERESSSMGGWLDALVRVRASGAPATLVSVVSTKGSVPRGAGTRMVVTPDTVDGTIGGGHLEFSAIGIARDMLSATRATAGELRRFPLGASLGQCCGGVVSLLFERVDADQDWVATLAALRENGTEVVVATPSDRAVRGRMLITADTASGSLGDAHLETNVVAAARRLLVDRAGAHQQRVASGEAKGELIFLDPLRAPEFPIFLFGAGHVARALVGLLSGIACRVTWVDARESEFPVSVPGNVTVVVTDTPEAEVTAAPEGAYFLVMTHSHPLDQALAEAILRRGGFAYFGLIGSMSKRAQFERRMSARGIAAARLSEMTSPIGVPGITGKEPTTIAIAVVAQLLQVKERRALAQRTGTAEALHAQRERRG